MTGALAFAGVYGGTLVVLVVLGVREFVLHRMRRVEDREVEALDAIYEMPSFDPETYA